MKGIRELRRLNAISIFNELRDRRGSFSQSDWAEMLGTAQNRISEWLRGSQGISEKTARAMEATGKKPLNWLDQNHEAHTEGLVTPGHAGVTYLPNTKREPGRLLAPLLSWQEALEAQVAVARGAQMLAEARAGYPCPASAGADTFALRAQGVSNEPDIKDGEIIFVDPGRPAEHMRFVIVQLPGATEAVLRRYIEEGGKAYLVTANPNLTATPIPIDEHVRFLGRVIGKWADL